MKVTILLFITFLFSVFCQAEALHKIVPKSFSKLMKTAIESKDAPATCWYLGFAEGYLRAMKDSGNGKAAKLVSDTKDAEGKCGGKNSLDLKMTFTTEEWAKLSALQQKIEATEL